MAEGFWLGEPEQKDEAWSLAKVYADLGTRTDVAKALDVTEWRVNRWIERRAKVKCPMPVKRLGHIDAYSLAEWKTWYGRWISREKKDKRVSETKLHGSGESFFTYWR